MTVDIPGHFLYCFFMYHMWTAEPDCVKETLSMKCKILFYGKNKKNVSKYRLLKFLPRVQRVNYLVMGKKAV